MLKIITVRRIKKKNLYIFNYKMDKRYFKNYLKIMYIVILKFAIYALIPVTIDLIQMLVLSQF